MRRAASVTATQNLSSSNDSAGGGMSISGTTMGIVLARMNALLFKSRKHGTQQHCGAAQCQAREGPLGGGELQLQSRGADGCEATHRDGIPECDFQQVLVLASWLSPNQTIHVGR